MDNGIAIDAIQTAETGPAAYGAVAARLLSSGFKTSALRTNTVLRKEEWLQYDTTVVEVARQRLRGVADLINAGLTYNLTNALGTMVVQWESMSDMNPAEVSMAAVTQGQNDRVVFTPSTLPIPIIHKDFMINVRALEASRRLGEPLDTTQAAIAARKVSEKIEEMLFLGGSITAGGGTVYGYLTAPNHNTGSLSGNWAVASTTGEEIVLDVLAMMQSSNNDHMYGPYILYVPNDYFNRLGDDYKAASDRTILERLLALPGIQDVRSAEQLPGGATGKVVLVQMTRDVIDLVNGMEPTPIMWETNGGLTLNFKVMAIMVPRIKSDYLGQSGITVYTAP